jgi:hypothetical protein
MSQQVWGLLGGSPGAACQRCHSVTYRQIHSLDESRVQSSREAHPLQSGLESGTCSKAHDVRNPHQLALPVAFLHLSVNQSFRHLPLACFPLSMIHLAPVSKMGRESIEVEIEPVTRKEWEATRSQEFSQGVDDPMRCVLRAGAQIKHGQKLCAGVDSQLQPEYLCTAA